MKFFKALGGKPKTGNPATVGQQTPIDKGRTAEVASPSSPKKSEALKDTKNQGFLTRLVSSVSGRITDAVIRKSGAYDTPLRRIENLLGRILINAENEGDRETVSFIEDLIRTKAQFQGPQLVFLTNLEKILQKKRARGIDALEETYHSSELILRDIVNIALTRREDARLEAFIRRLAQDMDHFVGYENVYVEQLAQIVRDVDSAKEAGRGNVNVAIALESMQRVDLEELLKNDPNDIHLKMVTADEREISNEQERRSQAFAQDTRKFRFAGTTDIVTEKEAMEMMADLKKDIRTILSLFRGGKIERNVYEEWQFRRRHLNIIKSENATPSLKFFALQLLFMRQLLHEQDLGWADRETRQVFFWFRTLSINDKFKVFEMRSNSAFFLDRYLLILKTEFVPSWAKLFEFFLLKVRSFCILLIRIWGGLTSASIHAQKQKIRMLPSDQRIKQVSEVPQTKKVFATGFILLLFVYGYYRWLFLIAVVFAFSMVGNQRPSQRALRYGI